MTISAAVWCLACGAPPDCAITIERNGVMAHYGACWDHVVTVAHRARDEVRGHTPTAHAWRTVPPPPPVAVEGGGGTRGGAGLPGAGGAIEGQARG